MKKKTSVFYIESPMQLLSAACSLRNQSKCILVYRDTNPQLEELIKGFSFLGNADLIKVNNIFTTALVVFKLKYWFSLDMLGLGDIRSFYSLLFTSLLKRQKTVLFDDGGYTISLDQEKNTLLNTSFSKMKSSSIDKLLSEDTLHRETIFLHDIKRRYRSIVRNKLRTSLSFFAFNDDNELTSLPDHGDPTLYYIESSLEGWVSTEIETEIYTSLQRYCGERGLKLVIIGHRKVDMARLNKLTSTISDYHFVKLDYPIEFYFSTIDLRSNCIAFTVTTAVFTAVQSVLSAKILQVKLRESHFFNQYRNYVSNYHKEVFLELDKSTLDMDRILI